MNRVISYSRISLENQSQFSIPFQNEQIIEFCNRNNYKLVEMFIDEGQSAKNFERKEWRNLEKYLKENKGSIDYLIVYKYDRFSRNLSEALIMIEKLEQEYDIKLLSISEQIPLPPDHPMFFHIRTTTLLNSHHERLVIRQRTVEGMKKAVNEGYYLYRAPFGYINSRDDKRKPILKLDTNSHLVSNAFQWFLQGYSYADIRRKFKAAGYNFKGNSSIRNILENKVYAGYVKSNFGKDGATYVKGNHLPLVDEETFVKVQEQIKEDAQVKRKSGENDIAYLKSAIVCSKCGKPMTCSRSKGRTKYYWYYECSNHRKSYNITKAHDKLDMILQEITFTDSQIEFMQDVTEKEVKKYIKDNFGRLGGLKKQRTTKAEMLYNLEEKFLKGLMDDDTFVRWRSGLQREIKSLDSEITTIEQTEKNSWELIINEFSRLGSIHDVFEQASTMEKRELLKVGFGRLLSWDGSVYRTGYLNPIFSIKVLELRRLSLLKYEPKKSESIKLSLGSP